MWLSPPLPLAEGQANLSKPEVRLQVRMCLLSPLLGSSIVLLAQVIAASPSSCLAKARFASGSRSLIATRRT